MYIHLYMRACADIFIHIPTHIYTAYLTYPYACPLHRNYASTYVYTSSERSISATTISVQQSLTSTSLFFLSLYFGIHMYIHIYTPQNLSLHICLNRVYIFSVWFIIHIYIYICIYIYIYSFF